MHPRRILTLTRIPLLIRLILGLLLALVYTLALVSVLALTRDLPRSDRNKFAPGVLPGQPVATRFNPLLQPCAPPEAT